MSPPPLLQMCSAHRIHPSYPMLQNWSTPHTLLISVKVDITMVTQQQLKPTNVIVLSWPDLIYVLVSLNSNILIWFDCHCFFFSRVNKQPSKK